MDADDADLSRPSTSLTRQSGAIALPGVKSFPVLDAFRQFLDMERRKARRRLVIMAVFFTILLLLAIGVGLYFGTMFFNQMNDDFRDVQKEVAQLQTLSSGLKKEAQAVLLNVDEKAARMHANLLQEREVMAKAKADAESRAQGYEGTFQQLTGTLRNLGAENQKLRQDLTALQGEWPRFTNSLQLARLEAPPITSPPPPAAGTTVLLSIVPRGYDGPVTWRVPVPE